MELADGLRHYRERDDAYWQLTLRIEKEAELVAALLLSDQPSNADAHTAAHDLVVAVERWKAMCLPERTGNAVKNTPLATWNALKSALTASSDHAQLRAVMELKGFGATSDPATGQQRAKAATAVLRFLCPHDWGVVDWRSLALLQMLGCRDQNMDEALKIGRLERATNLRKRFEIVDSGGAIGANLAYRAMRCEPYLPRAADVDMALFGLSLAVWPM